MNNGRRAQLLKIMSRIFGKLSNILRLRYGRITITVCQPSVS